MNNEIHLTPLLEMFKKTYPEAPIEAAREFLAPFMADRASQLVQLLDDPVLVCKELRDELNQAAKGAGITVCLYPPSFLRGVILRRRERDETYSPDIFFEEPENNANLLRDLSDEIQGWGMNYSFKFGIDRLDQVYGGLQPREIMVIVGAQGSMKSSLLLTGIETFIRRVGKRVLLFSLDMTAEEFFLRRIMREMDVAIFKARELIRDQDPQLAATIKEMEKGDKGLLKIRSTDRQWTIDDVVREVSREHPQLLAIDYLTRLKRRGQSDLECVEECMPKLKALTENVGLQTVVLSQMSRAGKALQSAGKQGQGSAKGGGIVEELAHCQIDLFIDGRDDDEEAAPRVIGTVTKARWGTQGLSFRLEVDAQKMRFTGKASRVNRKGGKKDVKFEEEHFVF